MNAKFVGSVIKNSMRGKNIPFEERKRRANKEMLESKKGSNRNRKG